MEFSGSLFQETTNVEQKKYASYDSVSVLWFGTYPWWKIDFRFKVFSKVLVTLEVSQICL